MGTRVIGINKFKVPLLCKKFDMKAVLMRNFSFDGSTDQFFFFGKCESFAFVTANDHSHHFDGLLQTEISVVFLIAEGHFIHCASEKIR